MKRNRNVIIITISLMLAVVIVGCIDDTSSNNKPIPITSGEILFQIWLENNTYHSVPEELFLHLSIKNIENDTLEYLEQLNHAVNINLTFPNGISREISQWNNMTWEPTYGYLDPQDEITWERRITYDDIPQDFFDPDEFSDQGTYYLFARYGAKTSNILEITIV